MHLPLHETFNHESESVGTSNEAVTPSTFQDAGRSRFCLGPLLRSFPETSPNPRAEPFSNIQCALFISPAPSGLSLFNLSSKRPLTMTVRRSFKCSIDYYKILRVPHNSDRLVIKNAYRQLALKFHPDRNDGCVTQAEIFKQISVAHEVLVDPELKSEYDAMRRQHKNRSGCFCRSWTEVPDVWITTETTVAQANTSVACHCKNCDPETRKRKEKERAQTERTERKRAKRHEEGVRARERIVKKQEERERADTERRLQAKAERKRRIGEQLEQEHLKREQERKQRLQQLRLDIQSRREARRAPVAADVLSTPNAPAQEVHKDPKYSTYWIDDDPMTPHYKMVRDDFYQAMDLHRKAREELCRLTTIEETENMQEVIEGLWGKLEAESWKWADASSMASRLRGESSRSKDGTAT